MKDYFLNGAVTGAIGFASKSGWITAEIFVHILEHIQKYTSSSPENRILLIVDNHEAHVSLNAINFCRQHGIVMLSFPPHCTHKMQRLDIGIYGPFKTRLKSSFNDFILSNPGKPITIYDIPKLSSGPYLLSFNPSNIIKAFQKSGIWPINRLAFDDSDFTGVLEYENENENQRISQVSSVPVSSTSGSCSNSDSGFGNRINIISNVILIPPSGIDNSSATKFAVELLDEIMSRVFTDSENKAQIQKILSPETIRPLPKLTPRSEKSKGRKRGRSRIYTNTPEKKGTRTKRRK